MLVERRIKFPWEVLWLEQGGPLRREKIILTPNASSEELQVILRTTLSAPGEEASPEEGHHFGKGKTESR